MGKLKDEATSGINNDDIKVHQLTDSEMNYLRLLNLCLQYHTMGQKIMSGFLYYVCTQRLGYKDGTNLQFELDFDKTDNLVTVKLLPTAFVNDPGAAAEGAAPAPTEPPAPAK